MITEEVYPRRGSRFKKPGTVTGRRRCTLEGCRGIQLSVKWPNGQRTFPCTDGMEIVCEALISSDSGRRSWRIL